MVDITLLEVHFPEARFAAEAEFNAPFAGRGSTNAGDGIEEEPASSTTRSPPIAPLVLAGILTIATLVLVRRSWRNQ